MTAGQLDPGLVRRIVRFAQAYLRNGSISEVHLLSVFELTEADELHRSAVRTALEATGMSVTGGTPPAPSAGVPETSELGSVVVPVQRPGIEQPGSNSAGVDEGSSVRAARRLLRQDRRRTKPWSRLLSAEEEVGLALLMRGGDLALDQELPPDFRSGLAAGDERAAAFDAFVLHNLRLAWNTAHKVERELLDVEDLKQVGYFGLKRAVEKFDASRGLKFSTYASNWVRQQIERAVADEGRLIRIPVYVWEEVRKVDAVQARLSAQKGYADLFDLSAGSGLPPERVVELRRLRAGVVSLDKPVGEDGGSVLGELLPDDGPLADPESVVLASLGRSEVAAALRELPDREARIMELRVGLGGSEPATLDEIGAVFGVTRERIRQIEKKAKGRLVEILERRGIRPSAVRVGEASGSTP